MISTTAPITSSGTRQSGGRAITVRAAPTLQAPLLVDLHAGPPHRAQKGAGRPVRSGGTDTVTPRSLGTPVVAQHRRAGQRLATVGAEAILGAVDRAAARARPADARLADHTTQLDPAVEGVLELAQLAVGLGGGLDLGLGQLGALGAEAVQLEGEAAQVAQLDLAQLAQVADATPQLGPLDEVRGVALTRPGPVDRRAPVPALAPARARSR